MELTALCVGQASVDWVGAVPRLSGWTGDRQELSAFTLQGGGGAANVAATLARLGGKVRFGGKLPDDYLGSFAADSLAEEGVDLSYLKRQVGGVPPVSFIALDGELRRRTVFFTRGDCEDLRPSDVSAAALEGVRLLYVDGAFPEAQLQLVKLARAKGVRSFLGARTMGPLVRELAACCDVVVASEEFARELSPMVPRALAELLSLGAQVALVTLGDDGSVGQEKNGEPVRVEAHPTKLVDATGAGDVYRGALAFAWLEGMGLREQMRFASAAAALKCQAYGARAGLPTIEAVQAALG
ncbi:MAG: carbohydrate kinase family protein [Myxococcota bacterium]